MIGGAGEEEVIARPRRGLAGGAGEWPGEETDITVTPD